MLKQKTFTKNILFVLPLLFVSLFAFVPSASLADSHPGVPLGDKTEEDKGVPLGEKTNEEKDAEDGLTKTVFSKLENPLGGGGVRSFTDFIEKLLNIVIMIGIPIVVLAIIWSGFLYVKAQGNPEKISAAHQTLLWTIIGAALLIGSYTIAKAIEGTVTKIGTGTASVLQDDRPRIG